MSKLVSVNPGLQHSIKKAPEPPGGLRVLTQARVMDQMLVDTRPLHGHSASHPHNLFNPSIKTDRFKVVLGSPVR